MSTTRRTVAKGAAAALVGAAAAHLASAQQPVVLPTDRPISVSLTIAALLARPVPRATLVALVLGYNAVNDGGGGLFYWDAQSTATANGGTVFKSNNSRLGAAGRWLRLDV
jgi:hypothetical protein